MSEVIVSKRTSLLIAATCLALGIYCLQFSLLHQRVEIRGIYAISLLVFAVIMLANFQGVRYAGLEVRPLNKPIVFLFWSAVASLLCLYALGAGDEVDVAKSRPAHFLVGIGLVVFFGLCFFGSFFSGFGVYLFLRNPISWVRDKARHSDWTK